MHVKCLAQSLGHNKCYSLLLIMGLVSLVEKGRREKAEQLEKLRTNGVYLKNGEVYQV